MNADVVAFKKQLEDRGTKGLVVDIDETISWTFHYMAGELAKLHGNPQNLTEEELCERIVAQDIPFWKVEEVQAWMASALESEEITEEYPIIEGSDEAIERVDRVIPVVGYLTLRKTLIRDATKRWLKKHGFPDKPVITRPDDLETKGMRWKAETLAYLYPQVIGSIDDTPEIINYLPGDYRGTIFLYRQAYYEAHYGNRDHTRRDLNIIPCDTWDDVYEKVVEHRASLERAADRCSFP